MDDACREAEKEETSGPEEGEEGWEMKAKDDPIILEGDPLTEPTQVTMWRSRNGVHSVDYDYAKQEGVTHVKCKSCEAIVKKYWGLCDECKYKAGLDRHMKRERVVWEEGMVYSEAKDEYFQCPCDAVQELELESDGEDYDPWSLMLVETRPEYPYEIDEDFFHDQLPEDEGVPEQVAEAIKIFNESIKGVVMCYTPTNRAIDMSMYERKEDGK
jgi:hypothetical protein